MENQTIAYYNQNAASFIQGTVSVDFQMTRINFQTLCRERECWISGTGVLSKWRNFLVL